MRKFIKELTVLTIQLLMFYVSPLFAGPKDAMGMVLMILQISLPCRYRCHLYSLCLPLL